ncbi:hypothetical protein HDU67_005718, partial [Dinochytrium kinnereticum]
MDDMPAYLQEGWRTEDKSINELISILSERGVEMPAKREKKPFYVDLFEKEILANKDRIKAEWQRLQMMSPHKRKSVAASISVASASMAESPRRQVKSKVPSTPLVAASSPQPVAQASARKSRSTPEEIVVLDEDGEGGEDDEVPLHRRPTERTSSLPKPGTPEGPAKKDEDKGYLPPSVTARFRSETPNHGYTSTVVSPNSSIDTIDMMALQGDLDLDDLNDRRKTFGGDVQPMRQASHRTEDRGRRRATLAGGLEMSEQPRSGFGTPNKLFGAPTTPNKFMDLQRLATPVKDLPRDLAAMMGSTPGFGAPTP